MSRRKDVKRLIDIHERRLQILREQQATRGVDTPPHILTEIEDIKAEIEALQTELNALENSSFDKESPNREILTRVSVQRGDIYSSYEIGLSQLLNRIGQQHSRYSDALVYQQRLQENIAQSRRHGDTETRRAERSEIIERLNELAVSALDTTFDELAHV